MSIYRHKHHIIPKHAGGTNDPSNLVELTVEQHAEAHRLLYEEHGRWEDKLAWQALSGQIGKSEIIRHAASLTHKGIPKSKEHKLKLREAKLGMKHSAETRRKMSEAHMGHPGWNKGISPSIETRRKMSESRKGVPKTKKPCTHCGKNCSPSNLSRWHNDNCKSHNA